MCILIVMFHKLISIYRKRQSEYKKKAILYNKLMDLADQTSPIIHSNNLKPYKSIRYIFKTWGVNKRKFKKPSNLAIVLVNDFKYKTIMEQSLDFFGIEDYYVLKIETPEDGFRTIDKLPMVLDFAKKNRKRYEHILYCDSNDCVLRRSPEDVMEIYESFDCDLLFGSVKFSHGNDCMPEKTREAEEIAQKEGVESCERKYLNSGVYLGKTEFMIGVLNKAVSYITEQDTSWSDSWDLCKAGKLKESYTNFPYGCGDDQMVLRYIFPEFYPRIKLDYEQKFVHR